MAFSLISLSVVGFRIAVCVNCRSFLWILNSSQLHIFQWDFCFSLVRSKMLAYGSLNRNDGSKILADVIGTLASKLQSVVVISIL